MSVHLAIQAAIQAIGLVEMVMEQARLARERGEISDADLADIERRFDKARERAALKADEIRARRNESS